MTPETALQLTIAAALLATLGLIASEVRANLAREREKDEQRRREAPDALVGSGAPFADVLQPPDSKKAKR